MTIIAMKKKNTIKWLRNFFAGRKPAELRFLILKSMNDEYVNVWELKWKCFFVESNLFTPFGVRDSICNIHLYPWFSCIDVILYNISYSVFSVTVNLLSQLKLWSCIGCLNIYGYIGYLSINSYIGCLNIHGYIAYLSIHGYIVSQ